MPGSRLMRESIVNTSIVNRPRPTGRSLSRSAFSFAFEIETEGSREVRIVPRRLDTGTLVDGVLACDRAMLGRAITLLESRNRRMQEQAQELLTRLLPSTGRSQRIGITGVPGAGKSTFIEALGTRLTSRGHRVAVLAVDPSSRLSGGSILGDKTRMNRLAIDPNAFVRPTPSGLTFGGVARTTRETLLVCEAAGFDIVMVETVGVGQSESTVADMVDTFLILMIAGAGDELQGIKRGVLELVDLLAINKADGENTLAAQRDAVRYRSALRMLRPPSKHWKPPVLTCSAKTGDGLDELWATVQEHRRVLTEAGELDQKRKRQLLHWTWGLVEHELITSFHAREDVQARKPELEQAVVEGQITPTEAAQQLLVIGSPNHTPSPK